MGKRDQNIDDFFTSLLSESQSYKKIMEVYAKGGYTAFYRTKEEFRKAVLAFFKDIGKYKTSLETLLTMNFHIFEKMCNFG